MRKGTGASRRQTTNLSTLGWFANESNVTSRQNRSTFDLDAKWPFFRQRDERETQPQRRPCNASQRQSTRYTPHDRLAQTILHESKSKTADFSSIPLAKGSIHRIFALGITYSLGSRLRSTETCRYDHQIDEGLAQTLARSLVTCRILPIGEGRTRFAESDMVLSTKSITIACRTAQPT
jgi:hypothetical protein